MSDELKIVPLSWGNKLRKVKPNAPIKSLADTFTEVKCEQEEQERLEMENYLSYFDLQ